MTPAIGLLKALIIILTFALSPQATPEFRAQAFITATTILQQVNVEVGTPLPIITPTMNQGTPSPSAPAPVPAPSAPETPEASVEAVGTSSVAPQPVTVSSTPFVELVAEGNSLRWKSHGVGETLNCTLDGKVVAQEGEKAVDSGMHILICVGVKSGEKIFREIII